MADDILAAILREFAHDVSADELRAREARLRVAWGGARVYVSKDVPTLKTWALAGSLAAGATLREAFDAAGCSRRTGYRLLSRRWR
jgi:hypothetical protein